jgi:hypothetical protein
LDARPVLPVGHYLTHRASDAPKRIREKANNGAISVKDGPGKTVTEKRSRLKTAGFRKFFDQQSPPDHT